MREWEDLVEQLRQSARDLDIALNEEGEPDAGAIHRAILAGLLSHVGLRREETREYTGARGARFVLSPGSVLARRLPRVGDGRRARADLAPVGPHGRERPAELDRAARAPPGRAHLQRAALGRTARGRDRDREGDAVRAAVVPGRTVPYARIDAAAARDLFLRHALLQGDWPAGETHAFVAENRRRIEEVHELENRARRRDLLAGEAPRLAFLHERVPAEVTGGAEFDKWWRELGDPQWLVYPRSVLVNSQASVDREGRPDHWREGDVELEARVPLRPGRGARRRDRRRARRRFTRCGRRTFSGSCRECAGSW